MDFQDLVIPVAIDNTQPEYVIKAETYAERMRVRWQPGDRFRMFFGGQVSRKTHKRVKTGAAAGRVRQLMLWWPPWRPFKGQLAVLCLAGAQQV